MNISELKGVGPKKEKIFKQIGVETTENLLHVFPRRYLDKSVVKTVGMVRDGEAAVIEATVIDLKVMRRPGRKEILILSIENDGKIGEIVFFNATYMKQRFKFQKTYYFYGKIEKQYGKFKLVHPDFSDLENKDFLGIEPVYSLPEGISQRNMRQLIHMILQEPLNENLPDEIIERRNLRLRDHAYRNIHFPLDRMSYKEAKFRLIYEEFFLFILGNELLKQENRLSSGISIPIAPENNQKLISQLDFSLTDDQNKVLREIEMDMKSNQKMNRLLQGDVGSGKTIVAILMSYDVVLAGHQVAVMVPTEILARQHFESFKAILPDHVNMALLTGRTKMKNTLYRELTDGTIDLVIGTHALIQKGVLFSSLGLVVTDEQHRFGVNQRKILLEKNPKANYLMMSATPIPRTMSMILYSDIDLSTIETMPAGRREIITQIGMDEALIKNLLDRGQQGYVVFPLIEESEFFENVKSIEKGIDDIVKIFKDYKIGIVHGKMKEETREETIKAFRSGEYQILIATTVIEVGIDVPNASFIMIENAERFGLSQLHQLRGRVGRGVHQSYCFLMSGDGQHSNERLEVLTQSNDGFVISQRDLEIRGPGEVLGIRQHGSNSFLIADFFRHQDILDMANEDVMDLLNSSSNESEYINKHRKGLRI